jgi:hypothetical protein
MNDPEKPLVYLILGAAGSGRRQVLVDLIADGLTEADRPAVMLPAEEASRLTDPHPLDETLPSASRWRWEEGAIAGELPAQATHIFFITDGTRNPVDQVEVFKPWLQAQGGELARVICIVNSQLAARHPALLAWFEACVHFADVVLLNKREGVENKWMSGFLGHFKKLYYPCVFELVKDGQVQNPALILEPQARRMTHIFDEEQDWIFTDAEGKKIDEDDETADDDEEIVATPEEDPYFVRRNGGRRLKEIPDIAKFL